MSAQALIGFKSTSSKSLALKKQESLVATGRLSAQWPRSPTLLCKSPGPLPACQGPISAHNGDALLQLTSCCE